jgi:hypothetical protein
MLQNRALWREHRLLLPGSLQFSRPTMLYNRALWHAFLNIYWYSVMQYKFLTDLNDRLTFIHVGLVMI